MVEILVTLSILLPILVGIYYKFTRTDDSWGLDLVPQLPLGANFNPDCSCTLFSVFSPRADWARLNLYREAHGGDPVIRPMKRERDGVWTAAVKGNLAGSFYTFSVHGPSGFGDRFDSSVELSDPYARANCDHNGRSLVIEPGDFDWEGDERPGIPLDKLVIYEMHVRDFTFHPSSGLPVESRGRYRGILHEPDGSVALGHLKELGINAVELMPVYEFDNFHSGQPNHWGYMTSHFFAPEGYYSSGEHGSAVREMKELVKGLHREGIRVILDVVYNHTCEGNDRGPILNLKGLANQVYYRVTGDHGQFYWNGTGCGNELRSEHPATRKLIIDSLKAWVEEYHVDGFRFDLAASLDLETLKTVRRELPGDILLIAEPWNADWSRRHWDKGALKGLGWSNWNDDFKRNIRAFVSGRIDHHAGSIDNIITVMGGSCFWGWVSSPVESINYIECHDNDCLCDFLNSSVRANRLAAVILLTSRGIPMIHQGQELMKSKNGNSNSYDQDNEINWIDWALKEKNRAIFEFYSGLIGLRHKFSALRRLVPMTPENSSWLRTESLSAIGFCFHALNENDQDIVVLINGSRASDGWAWFFLPDGFWIKVCDGERVDDSGILGWAKGNYGVPPLCGIVLKKAGPEWVLAHEREEKRRQTADAERAAREIEKALTPSDDGIEHIQTANPEEVMFGKGVAEKPKDKGSGKSRGKFRKGG